MGTSLQNAKKFEETAKETSEIDLKMSYYSKAASLYRERGSTDDEVRCLLSMCKLVEGLEQVKYLVDCWKAYISAIVVFKYETSYEWKGEKANLREDYNQIIDEYVSDAAEILKQILRIRGVDRNKLLETLAGYCANSESDGGWGTKECWKSIEDAWKT